MKKIIFTLILSFIVSITFAQSTREQIIDSLGFIPIRDLSPFTTQDLAEYPYTTDNQYFNSARFNTAISSITTNAIVEGTSNFYFTVPRARASFSITNTGSTGNASYDFLTGIVNIPNYTVTSGLINSALGYTPPSQTTSDSRYVMVSSSYTNPSWITSIPSTKVTGLKRQDLYSGTTNSSGIYTITYPTSFVATPNIQYNLGTGSSNKWTILLTASSSTSCSFYVQLRTDIAGLLPTYSNVTGALIDVVVTEK